MQEYLSQFEKEQKKHKSKNTVEAYMSDLKHFFAYLQANAIEFTAICNDTIKNYTDHLLSLNNKRNAKSLSPKTVNRHLISIKLFIYYFNSIKDNEDKIFVDIKTLKVQQTYYLEDLLTKNEFVRMLNKTKDDNNELAETIFMTLYYTGARVSEMLAITPRHIKEDSLVIKGKGSKYRELILADDIIDVLSKYTFKKHIGYDERLFPITRQTVHMIIKKYAGMCRINLKHASAHKFRHLHAIDLLENGATIEEVADELGHSDINTTRIYTKKDKKELKKTVNRLSVYRN